MSGDSPLEYSVKKLFTDVTAISQDAVQNVGIDLLFVDSRGLISMRTMREYGDIEKSIVSRDINNTYLIPYSSQITAKVEMDNQFWMTISTNKVAVFDVEVGAWTIYQFELGTGIIPTSFGIINGVTYLGASDGNLYYLDYTKKQDNATNFSLLATTGWIDLGLLMAKKASFIDVVLSAPATGTYTLTVYKNLSGTAAKTLTLTQLYSAYHNVNNLSMEFNQIKFSIGGLTSSTGPHWLDRIVLECSILSRVT
jgi:hypothetical protein